MRRDARCQDRAYRGRKSRGKDCELSRLRADKVPGESLSSGASYARCAAANWTRDPRRARYHLTSSYITLKRARVHSARSLVRSLASPFLPSWRVRHEKSARSIELDEAERRGRREERGGGVRREGRARGSRIRRESQMDASSIRST